MSGMESEKALNRDTVVVVRQPQQNSSGNWLMFLIVIGIILVVAYYIIDMVDQATSPTRWFEDWFNIINLMNIGRWF